jgi:hypothetical protein
MNAQDLVVLRQVGTDEGNRVPGLLPPAAVVTAETNLVDPAVRSPDPKG